MALCLDRGRETSCSWTLDSRNHTKFLEAVLHEMTKVIFLMFLNCAPFARSKNQAAIGGLSGHGVSAGKLWREMELEADRKFKGLPRP